MSYRHKTKWIIRKITWKHSKLNMGTIIQHHSFVFLFWTFCHPSNIRSTRTRASYLPIDEGEGSFLEIELSNTWECFVPLIPLGSEILVDIVPLDMGNTLIPCFNTLSNVVTMLYMYFHFSIDQLEFHAFLFFFRVERIWYMSAFRFRD